MTIGLKLEFLNPGGSFKDRGAYVTVARCAELDFPSIVVDSSGNAGLAVALMGLRFGVKVDVFLPRSTPDGKKQLLRVLRARMHEVDGDRMAVHGATLEYAASTGAAYAGHWWNPYFAHGVKTMAYEAADQMPPSITRSCRWAPAPCSSALNRLLRAGLRRLHGIMPRLSRCRRPATPRSAQSGRAAPVGARITLAYASPSRTRRAGWDSTPSDKPTASAGGRRRRHTAALAWLAGRGRSRADKCSPLAGLMRAMQNGRVPKGSSVSSRSPNGHEGSGELVSLSVSKQPGDVLASAQVPG